MSGHVTVGRVQHFRECDPADKAMALKPLEEASEVLEAWKAWRGAQGGPSSAERMCRRALLDENARNRAGDQPMEQEGVIWN